MKSTSTKSGPQLDVKALKAAMAMADCSTAELAQVLGISPSALYRRMKGEVFFTLGEIMACMDRLGLTTLDRNRIFFAEKVS